MCPNVVIMETLQGMDSYSIEDQIDRSKTIQNKICPLKMFVRQ